jgi:hypothetical protein
VSEFFQPVVAIFLFMVFNFVYHLFKIFFKLSPLKFTLNGFKVMCKILIFVAKQFHDNLLAHYILLTSRLGAIFNKFHFNTLYQLSAYMHTISQVDPVSFCLQVRGVGAVWLE